MLTKVMVMITTGFVLIFTMILALIIDGDDNEIKTMMITTITIVIKWRKPQRVKGTMLIMMMIITGMIVLSILKALIIR